MQGRSGDGIQLVVDVRVALSDPRSDQLASSGEPSAIDVSQIPAYNVT